MRHYRKDDWRGSTALTSLEFKNDDNGGQGGEPDPVKAIEELSAALTGKMETFSAELKKVNDKVDAEVAKRKRPGAEHNNDDSDKIERKAFETFLRKGREALSADEVKTLRISDDTAGGYLAEEDFVAEVDKNIVQYSPVRQAARVGQTASGAVIIPKRTGRPTASWVGETETRTETESTYGQAEIPIDEMACYVDVSNKLLEDAAVDVGAEVAFDVAEEFGRAEGAAFVSGNGVKKPLGFMSDTNVSYTPGGHATLIQADGLIDLYYALAPFYRQRGVWMINGSTLAAIRKLKDLQGRYLWEPSLVAGSPETILGRPAIEAVDMPDIAANAYPVAFGDFSSGFRIYDRVSLSLIRDPYTQATSGLTRFHARRRVGARVVRAETIRKLKIAVA
jgi:HK97 family phage major capsid protein